MAMVPMYRPMVPVYAPPMAYVPQEKSVGGAIALSFFFGPLGMLYSTVPGALTMRFAGFFFTLITLGFGIFLVWPACVLWSALAANSHNDKVRGQLHFMQGQQMAQMQYAQNMAVQQQLLAARSQP